ncbi:IclR family transcriptional regulator [Microterricola viridarii]|uniref:DNA-binding transcriptional regulator, IclR family n=1 Tax=Microterricola viridarii TaxID=412690 RepID=A0A1H1PJ10_9MICO|nr:IclR family transcriptional regulator [Microterricola viridarii]SDS11124.1 DNA-binding transcriptional regulator, IclR family [Microterricola viridarii]
MDMPAEVQPPRPAPTRGKRPPRGEPVIDRALSLLNCFSDDRRELSLGELSARSGIPLSSTLRLAQGLLKWGALERLPGGDFVIGVRLWEVASLAPRGHGVREIALPFLEDLYEVSRHHVLLAVQDGREAILIERLSSRRAPAVAYRLGGRLPLRSTAVGRVLLAAQPTPEREATLALPLDEDFQVENLGSIEALRLELKDVARLGYSVVRRTQPSHTISLAAPVFGANRQVAAAVSILAPDGAFTPDVALPALRATARSISRALGYHPPGIDGIRSQPDRESR